MIFFRPHRGSFSESMKESVKFRNVAEMNEHVKRLWPEMKNGEITIDHKEIYDARNGWNTRYILMNGQVIGMCDISRIGEE